MAGLFPLQLIFFLTCQKISVSRIIEGGLASARLHLVHGQDVLRYIENRVEPNRIFFLFCNNFSNCMIKRDDEYLDGVNSSCKMKY